MNKRKKYCIIGIVISVLIFGCAALIVAGGNSINCPRFGHRGDFKGDFKNHILKHMDEKVVELNLNAEQEQAYEKIKQNITDDMETCAIKRRNFIGEIKTELNKEDPDISKISDHTKLRIDKMHNMISNSLNQIVEFYELLDEDQQEILIERMKDRIEKCTRS